MFGSTIGRDVTVETLTEDPYATLAKLRNDEPVSWIPSLGAWMITRRDLAIEAMRDAEAFTVDDPRFSTAAVLGESMLSLDGPEHQRHRSPFAPSFRPGVVRERFDQFLADEAAALVQHFAAAGWAELRTALAGPLAVNTITKFLGLESVTAEEVLGWYQSISAAITDVTLGAEIADGDQAAIAQLRDRVTETLAAASEDSLLTEIAAEGVLRPEELGPATAVIMFGAIETAEGMTANALWHLLTHPEQLEEVKADRTLIDQAIEESLRLEPAAGVVDRYATRDVEIGGVTIKERDLVTISLLAANRDPAMFDDPDRFDIHRHNAKQHVTFVQGPHGCLGIHLTRMETSAAIHALLDAAPNVRLDYEASTAPAGLIFRKSESLIARWD